MGHIVQPADDGLTCETAAIRGKSRGNTFCQFLADRLLEQRVLLRVKRVSLGDDGDDCDLLAELRDKLNIQGKEGLWSDAIQADVNEAIAAALPQRIPFDDVGLLPLAMFEVVEVMLLHLVCDVLQDQLPEGSRAGRIAMLQAVADPITRQTRERHSAAACPCDECMLHEAGEACPVQA